MTSMPSTEPAITAVATPQPTVPLRRILFVDDEPQLLKALRSLLRRQCNVWDMTFLASGEEGLKALEEGHYDVVVSDMRMPRMNGEQFLREVQQRYPHIARFILSGQSDMETALRSVSVAHQFFAKPFEPTAMRDIVDRTCDLLSLVSDERMRACLGGIPELPSMPRICGELSHALSQDSSTNVIVDIVERDIALSAKLLQIINSAFFGSPRRVTSVKQAVMTLGLGVLRSLAMSVHLSSSFTGGGASARAVEALQVHSIHVGRLAQQLCGGSGELAENAFSAGMLHDVGKLILLQHRGAEFRDVVDRARIEGRPRIDLEREVFGVTHGEIGAYLLGLWGLPIDVVEAVAHHHTPGKLARPGFSVLAAIHLADLLAQGYDEPDQGAALVESCDAEARAYLDSIGAPERTKTWERVAAAHRSSLAAASTGGIAT